MIASVPVSRTEGNEEQLDYRELHTHTHRDCRDYREQLDYRELHAHTHTHRDYREQLDYREIQVAVGLQGDPRRRRPRPSGH